MTNKNLIINQKPVAEVREVENTWEQELVEYFWNQEMVNNPTEANNKSDYAHLPQKIKESVSQVSIFVRIEFQNCSLATANGKNKEIYLEAIEEVEKLITDFEKGQVRLVNDSWFSWNSQNQKTRRTTTALLKSLRTIIQEHQKRDNLLGLVSVLVCGEKTKAWLSFKDNWKKIVEELKN